MLVAALIKDLEKNYRSFHKERNKKGSLGFIREISNSLFGPKLTIQAFCHINYLMAELAPCVLLI